MSAAILIEHVVKTFPSSYSAWTWLRRRGNVPRTTVLDGITLAIEQGELFGLLGANGAGKSTLLKLLATIALPDAGTIRIDGIQTHRAPLEARRRIALCGGSERSFYFRLTVRQNLMFFGALVDLRGAHLTRRIVEVLELVDLRDVIDQKYARLSSGMRQRLSVARALLAEPAIVLFDEPTRAVDPVHAAALRRLMRDRLIGELGKTVLLATNILEEAWSCDRVAMLSRGRVVACDTPANLSRAANARYAISVDRIDGALLERTRAVPGIRTLQIGESALNPTLLVEFDEARPSLTALLRAVSANGSVVLDIRPDEPAAADVFTELSGRGASDE
ncbi:MAG: ABC transporter ATP-binding protein [Candidatus Velthaea sp.]